MGEQTKNTKFYEFSCNIENQKIIDIVKSVTTIFFTYNRILAVTFVGSIFASYLLATALYSPGMLWGAEVGGTLTVSNLTTRLTMGGSSLINVPASPWNYNPYNMYQNFYCLCKLRFKNDSKTFYTYIFQI